MKNVDEGADAVGETKFDVLPERVQEALGELAGAAKEGLLALSVGVGLGVLMAEEVDDVVGPKGRHDVDRAAVRHGSEAGQVTLGGRRVPVERPRVRATDGCGEVQMATYAHFADRDPLTAVVLEQMLAGVSTRRFSRTREPVGEEVVDAERSTSKSAVSREFVGRTSEQLRALMSRSLGDVRLARRERPRRHRRGHEPIDHLPRQHHDDRARRYARSHSLITGPPPPSSTANGTTSFGLGISVGGWLQRLGGRERAYAMPPLTQGSS